MSAFAEKAAIIEDCLERKNADRATRRAAIVGYTIADGETYCGACYRARVAAGELLGARVFEVTRETASYEDVIVHCSDCGLPVDPEERRA